MFIILKRQLYPGWSFHGSAYSVHILYVLGVFRSLQMKIVYSEKSHLKIKLQTYKKKHVISVSLK